MDVSLQRSNIDLPADVMQKLSQLAIRSGKSLKSYMESVLTTKAHEARISPSGDIWFDDPENIKLVQRGIEQLDRGEGKTYTANELSARLGL